MSSPLAAAGLEPNLAATLNGHQPEDGVRAAYEAVSANDPLGGMIAADVATILPDAFLVKTDRATMAHGLELRPPLLDHELLELAARIPSRHNEMSGQTKWIFKQAYSRQLPASVLWRRKQGFEIPTDEWLRGPLRPMFEACVLDRQATVHSLIDQDVAGNLFRAHCSRVGRHGNVLWSLLVLARWAERYLRQLNCKCNSIENTCVNLTVNTFGPVESRALILMNFP